MGIPEVAAKHAVYNTGNNNADMAVTWYFENMSNPAINTPLKVKKSVAAAPAGVSRDIIEGLMACGFSEKAVLKALSSCDNNPERAGEWLFSHPDEVGGGDEEMTDVNEEEKYLDNNPGVYQLHGFITHLGSGTHSGHYVNHLRRDGKWIYFNDAKVAETNDPPIGKGYMYFFRKVQG